MGQQRPGGKEAVGGGGLVRPEHTTAPFPSGSSGLILTQRWNRSGNMHGDIAGVRQKWSEDFKVSPKTSHVFHRKAAI